MLNDLLNLPPKAQPGPDPPPAKAPELAPLPPPPPPPPAHPTPAHPTPTPLKLTAAAGLLMLAGTAGAGVGPLQPPTAGPPTAAQAAGPAGGRALISTAAPPRATCSSTPVPVQVCVAIPARGGQATALHLHERDIAVLFPDCPRNREGLLLEFVVQHAAPGRAGGRWTVKLLRKNKNKLAVPRDTRYKGGYLSGGYTKLARGLGLAGGEVLVMTRAGKCRGSPWTREVLVSVVGAARV